MWGIYLVIGYGLFCVIGDPPNALVWWLAVAGIVALFVRMIAE